MIGINYYILLFKMKYKFNPHKLNKLDRFYLLIYSFCCLAGKNNKYIYYISVK